MQGGGGCKCQECGQEGLTEEEHQSQGLQKEATALWLYWRKSTLGKGNSVCKVPEARPCLGVGGSGGER